MVELDIQNPKKYDSRGVYKTSSSPRPLDFIFQSNAQLDSSRSRREPKRLPNVSCQRETLAMHLSILCAAPLLFALGTGATKITASVTNVDGTVGQLRGCYANIGFNFFDTTGGSSPGFVARNEAASSVASCVQACYSSGYTYALIQGYNSK